MEIFTSEHCMKYVGKMHTVETWNRTQRNMNCGPWQERFNRYG